MGISARQLLGASIILLSPVAIAHLSGCGTRDGGGGTSTERDDASPTVTMDGGGSSRDSAPDVPSADADSPTDSGNPDAEQDYFGGQVEIAEADVDFGEVLTDQVLTKLFKLRNVGSEDLRIWKVAGS